MLKQRIDYFDKNAAGVVFAQYPLPFRTTVFRQKAFCNEVCLQLCDGRNFLVPRVR